MAIVVSNKSETVMGNKRYVKCDLTFDNNYVGAGGEPLTPAQFGLSSLDIVLIAPNQGVLLEYDYANSVVKAWKPTEPVVSGIGETVAAAADLSTVVARCVAFGS